ncbi:hypothetical protein [Leisingera sp. ANG-S3]|nr:hypothetical protein [Leisingera sp. ANG-S3]
MNPLARRAVAALVPAAAAAVVAAPAAVVAAPAVAEAGVNPLSSP